MNSFLLYLAALPVVVGCAASKPRPDPIALPNEPSDLTAPPAPAHAQEYCLDAQLVDEVPGLQQEPLRYAPESSAKNGKVVLFTRATPSAKTAAVTTGLCAVAAKARECRNAAALKGPNSGGFLELVLVIDDKGKLVSAKRTAGDIADTTLAECVETAVRGAAFDPAAHGETPIFVVARAVGEGRTVMMVEQGTDIQGGLPPEVIKRILRANFPRLRACYEALLKTNPFAEVDATIRFIIEESGKVTKPEVAVADPAFRTCLTTTVASLEFPEPEKGKVLVTYPLRFVTDY